MRVCGFVTLCVWVSHFLAVILWDILCWLGICRIRNTTIHAKVLCQTEGGSSAHFGIQLFFFGCSLAPYLRTSRDIRAKRMKDTTTSNATDAVLRALRLHHIYGHFFLHSGYFFTSIYHRVGGCVCQQLIVRERSGTRMYDTEWRRRRELNKVNVYFIGEYLLWNDFCGSLQMQTRVL